MTSPATGLTLDCFGIGLWERYSAGIQHRIGVTVGGQPWRYNWMWLCPSEVGLIVDLVNVAGNRYRRRRLA